MEQKIYSLIQVGDKIRKPKYKIGTKFHALYNTKDGIKMVDGKVIANDMVHFSSLEPMYTIETGDVDFIGRKIILDCVPESCFA